MYIRKFYDIDAPAEVAPNLAAVMAKSGVLRQPGDDGPVPSINTTEKKEEPTPATPSTPAPATETPKAEAKPSTPTPKKEEPAATPHTEPPQPVIPTWQEVLKSQQPSAILKELGFDERLADLKDLDPKVLGLLHHYKSNGNVRQYLAALDTDFQKMAPEEVMRHHLREQNPELDAKQLDRLYKLKVIDRYKLDPQLYSEDEYEDGKIELMADVKAIRTQLTTEQQKYLLPAAPEPKPAVPDPQEQQRQQEREAYQSFVNDNPYIRGVLADKKMTFGEGDDKFSYPVDPNNLLEVLFDQNKWGEHMFIKQDKPDGSTQFVPDVEKQALIAMIAIHGKDFLTQYAKHYKSLGGQKAIEPIENAKPKDPGAPAKAEIENMSPAAAAAKRGRLVSGGQ